jgi:hypothetical protein
MSRPRPMSDLLAGSGDAHGRVPSGYGERHARRVWVGTGEARLVSKDRWYKPVVKSAGGQRESDGVVVPGRGVVTPLRQGKGSDFGHAGEAGMREGMAGTAQSNYPEGRHLPSAKVRQLQNRLWAADKQSSDRRFHALYDRIYRGDILCTSSWALSDTPRQRNHVKKTVVKPCAGKPHARIERRMGKRARQSTAPLTTNELRRDRASRVRTGARFRPRD